MRILTATAIIFAVLAATIAESSAQINGCYNSQTGLLRILLNSYAECPPDETAIVWNQTGPEGDKEDAGRGELRELPEVRGLVVYGGSELFLGYLCPRGAASKNSRCVQVIVASTETPKELRKIEVKKRKGHF